ncbi:gamma-glutamylcyclotransferase [Niallia sp. NCCP-28]|uniref:gamma-glutamylcyclotransferase family protein n=1 Tax=Niallia sp. NCCP-28 TaxID=2934712 RepID=UPI0020843559|nr:gamma-glutamylcyclotransferase family protein [Niallia sp. NCCP-28]GKU82832.1 branched-chain alpha-keto acid dehydrogenase [Niallia sp. NCCP-28]
MENVFVYGSLKKQEKNHYMMENYSCLSMDAWIYGKLYDGFVGYPFLVLDKKSKVYGEIYQVPSEDLGILDEFEDYCPDGDNNLYERVEIDAFTKTSCLKAYVYVCVQTEMLKEEIVYGNWSLVEGKRKKDKE